MKMGDREQALMQRFPEVEWMEPQPVTTIEGTWLTCRFCTAIDGLKARELAKVGFDKHEQWASHVNDVHTRGPQ